MKINNHELPEAFVEAISKGELKRKIGSWNLIENHDAFGNKLETELGEVFNTFERISKETEKLPIGFEESGDSKDTFEDLMGPGAIPNIHDFSNIICFAISGDGSPFCFDYRNSKKEPSVIWWDDVYWRLVAPDFNSFISLFNIKTNS